MDSIEKLKNIFAKFPTVGNRTAGRFVYYLINQPKEIVDQLVLALQELKNKVKPCAFCFNPHETEASLCQICQNSGRNKSLLCLVEKEADLLSIEDTKKYKGIYFILGGNLLSEKLRLNELRERVADPKKFGLPENFSEIIVALNPTPEGKSASILIEKTLKEIPNSQLLITRLAKGLPVGGELEYADEETLESAFEGRK